MILFEGIYKIKMHIIISRVTIIEITQRVISIKEMEMIKWNT